MKNVQNFLLLSLRCQIFLLLMLVFSVSAKARDSLMDKGQVSANQIQCALNDRCKEVLDSVDQAIKLSTNRQGSAFYSFDLMGQAVQKIHCNNKNQSDPALKYSTIQGLKLKDVAELGDLKLHGELALEDQVLSLNLYSVANRNQKSHQVLFYSDCRGIKASSDKSAK